MVIIPTRPGCEGLHSSEADDYALRCCPTEAVDLNGGSLRRVRVVGETPPHGLERCGGDR
jgi:hypothetical protein